MVKTVLGRSKLSSIAAWALGLLLLAACGLYFAGYLMTRDAEKQRDKWVATNGPIVELGDGAHNIPITPEAALRIGQSGMVHSLRVTVTQVGEVEDTTGLQITAVGYQYWRVKYMIENMSAKEQYAHPTIGAQIQYEPHGDGFIRVYNQAGDCEPSDKKQSSFLGPGGRYACELIYEVPRGSQPLYWVYSSSYSSYNNSEESAVFKVR